MITKEVVKEGVKDKEIYIRVHEYRRYRIRIRDKITGKIIKEDIKYPVVKIVERNGRRRRKYLYVRFLLPWASTISSVVGYRPRYELVVEVE